MVYEAAFGGGESKFLNCANHEVALAKGYPTHTLVCPYDTCTLHGDLAKVGLTIEIAYVAGYKNASSS